LNGIGVVVGIFNQKKRSKKSIPIFII